MIEFMDFMIPEHIKYQIFDTEEGDEAWHELIKKYVAEDFWKYETTKGGPGSGNWGHQGLAGVHGGSSPTKNVKITDTPEFKKWFGDSKIVDENGDPKVVYHGTNNDFQVFDPEYAQWNEDTSELIQRSNPALFFAANPKWAGNYALSRGREELIIMPVYLKMERPLEVELWDEQVTDVSWLITEWYDSAAHDGLILHFEAGGYDYTTYVVWYPEQVKSVFNEGTFDPDEPNIMKEISRKGGQGSGNWGHSGLAGTWGGSSPTKTAGFSPVPSASKYFPKDWLSPNEKAQKSIEIMKKMSGKHSSGLEVAGSVQYNESYNKKTVLYIGHVYKNDQIVGSIQVEYDPNLFIGEIKEIMLDKSVQGTGFGKKYVEHIEDTLMEMGARELTLTATASVGGYFWAKVGYDFRSREGRDSVQRRLEKVWKSRYPMKRVPLVAMSSSVHSWEIAALRGHDGYKIGKEAMLGSSWFGGKVVAGRYSHYMGIDDTGYKIGKDYYND